MGEVIAFGLAQNIATGLGSRALREIGSVWGVTNEVKRLENTVLAIKALLPHAEQLQLSNNDVRLWLRRIKDAAYEAENIIDDFLIEALKKRVTKQQSIVKRVRSFALSSTSVVLHYKIAHRIEAVRSSLSDILADQSFGLENRAEVLSSEREQTHSYVVEAKVVGRDVEREEIVKLLLDPTGQGSISVIPIKGMGGIGKTTLAQLVYNDVRIASTFMQKMWVCVSDEFDVKKITEKIIRSATGNECPNLEMDQLQTRLREHLVGKKFLLVLDDVWNEDIDKWEALKDLLTEGATGSKIIVTTRNERVALITGTVSTYQLSELSTDDCWNLFRGRAFQGDEEQAHPELVEIGREIVNKCGGLPLAAKTLGGLCYKAEKEVWERVRNNDVWRLPEEENGIIRALRISYNHLPVYLKQCFAYCSIFPKDYDFKKDELIQFWIAQGFIHSSQEDRPVEDTANEYVKILMWRSFFQEPQFLYDNLESFKMHDLVHDLAKYVAGSECFTVSKIEEKFPEGVRHLFFNKEIPSSPFENPNGICNPSNIRTLVFAFGVTFPTNSIFSRLKFLRVLKFRDDTIDKLPNSIGKLKHLRHLLVWCDNIRTLPESITNLQSLEVLKLHCDKLEKWFGSIAKMVNLKHIDIEGCNNMSNMPFSIEELTSLRTLSKFIVSQNKIGCGLNELNGLINLGGKLQITNLENVNNSGESGKANLKSKKTLQTLTLSWNGVGNDGINREEVGFGVLENLEPHPNLKALKIENYTGTRFPRWMMEASFPYIVDVTLLGCRKCHCLPPFSRLPSLKELILYGMEELQYLEDKIVRGQIWFPSLKKLFILNAPNLENWVATGDVEHLSFPSLFDLQIHNSPKLKDMPLLPSVGHMILKECSGALVHSLFQLVIPNANQNPTYNSSLKYLTIEGCDDLECLPEDAYLTSLTTLMVLNCKSLTSLSSDVRYLTYLQILKLEYLPKLVRLPEGLETLATLRSLQIWACHGLQYLPEGTHCFGGLRRLTIVGCDNLMAWPSWLEHLTELRTLTVYCSLNLPLLPQEAQHLTSLQSLHIGYSEGLTTLPEWMVNLTSLHTFAISYCPNVEVLPEWVSGHAKMQQLSIHECDRLTSRYNKETGEDWHKLASLKLVKIDKVVQ